ncbi:MAG TPA: hypothetical protein VKB19_02475, partial [Pedobacter sp.]|nr:hypothetical protein [Pedobacter sp.]
VWGMVLYRVFASVWADEQNIVSPVNAHLSKKMPLPEVMPDTFELLLNYPDPFTGETPEVIDLNPKGTGKLRQNATANLPQVTPFNPLDHMKYLGYVADGKGNHRVAIISYQGQERMLKEGDTISRVKIIKIGKNAATASYAGKTRLLKTE